MAIEKVHIHIGVQLYPLWFQTNPQWVSILAILRVHLSLSSSCWYLEYLSSQDVADWQTLMNSPALTHIFSSVTVASKKSPEP